MNYIINKDIQFNTQENKLFSRKDHTHYAILSIPATHCLMLLLENSPEVVFHEVFLRRFGK